MNSLPFVSIILPTHNRKEALINCLQSLELQSYPLAKFEVVVVDDGSNDSTSKLIEDYTGRSKLNITYIYQNNSGPGLARNLGVQKSNGNVLGFIEDDVLPHKNWIENAIHHLSSKDIDGVEGITLQQNSEDSLRAFEKEYKMGFLPCNLFILKSVFTDVGGYNGDYFDQHKKYFFREDADFGFKVLERSYKFILAEDVLVSHPAQFFTLKDYYSHARRYYFDPLLHKNHPKLYRKMIEVKNIGPFTVHRPFHYSAILNVLNWVVIALALMFWKIPVIIFCIPIFLLTHIGIRYRYEKRFIPRLWNIQKTVGFFGLPFYYISWFLRGCAKFKNWRCIF